VLPRSRFLARSPLSRLDAILLLAGGCVFLSDLLTDPGISDYMLYAPITFAWVLRRPGDARAAVLLAIVLIAIGIISQPTSLAVPLPHRLANRGMGIALVCLAGWAGRALDRQRRGRDHAEQRAEQLAEIESLYAGAPVGLGLIDTELRFVRVNERMAAINGRPVSDHLGRAVDEVLPRHLAGMLERILRQVIDTGAAQRGVEIQGDDPVRPGEKRQWLGSYEPVRNARGEMLGVSVVVQDITRLKTAEREWQKRAQRLQTLYRLSELEARVADVDTLCVEAIEGVMRGLETPRAGILLRENGSFRFHACRGLSGRFQARFARHVTEVLRQEDVQDFVCHDTRRLPDGPFHQSLMEEGLHALALLPLDHHGEKLGALVVGFDRPRRFSEETLASGRAIARHVATAVDRRRRESALALSEKRFRSLSDSGILAIATFHLDGRILQANDAFLRLVGYTADEVKAGHVRWDQLTPPEWMERTRVAMEAARSTGRIEPYEKEYLRRDGSRLWGLFGGALVEDGSGVAFVLDITRRKEAEQRLKELTADLEVRVIERTREAEARAERARAMALELARTEERERRRLSQVLHDELQQYLVAARVQARSLKTKAPPEGELQAITARLVLLLDESLDATRALTRELAPPVLKTSGLVASMEWLARWMADRHGLAVRLEPDPHCDQVTDDAKVFAFQAVREMLLNVVKHSGVSSAVVRLGPCEGRVQVEVIDEGAGFHPGDLGTNGKDTGLGLSSLRQRVHDLGGEVEIDSRPGRGTRIRFTLPTQPPQERVPQAAPPEAAPNAIRVLVADDHPLVRQGVVSLLASEPDIRVVGEAADGAEVVGRAHDLRPDVVVMDVRMPVMDGIEATRRIRASLPDTKVVGLSQFDDEEAGVRMRAAGAGLFCSKDEAHLSLVQGIRSLKESNGAGQTS
jgi:PAS domain S-box-containing protein